MEAYNLLFIFGPIFLQDAQLQDRQGIERTLVLAAETAKSALLRLLANDKLVRSERIDQEE